MSNAIEAVLDQSSERYPTWLAVFGTNRVPVTSFVPTLCELPIGVRECFMLDVESLRPDQRESLCDHLSHKFGVTVDEVARELERVGLPILATDVYTVIDARLL